MNRYGTQHRKLRAQLVTDYEADGRGWPCALCNQPMTDHPSLLHLAHTDGGGHAGLAHRRCNSGENQADTNRAMWGKFDPTPTPKTRW